MTRPPPSLPPDPDDLASAIVDGLLPPHEAEAAWRDPAVARRVEDIRRIRATVRATPPAFPAAADAAVAAAVAAFDAQGASLSSPPPQHLRVVAPPPGSRHPYPAPIPRRSLPSAWLAAAAAVMVVVGLLAAGLLSQNGADEDQAATDAAPEASGGDGAQDSAESEAPTAAPDADDEALSESEEGGAASLSIPPPYLGGATDFDELQDLVDDNLDAGQEAAAGATRTTEGDRDAPGPPDVATEESCPGLSAAGDPDRGAQTFVADADFEGQSVRVHLYELGSERRLVATDQSCVDVVNELYPG